MRTGLRLFADGRETASRLGVQYQSLATIQVSLGGAEVGNQKGL
jgi:hypothetical protein